jgi:diguanylate cyclase (GGDEF)-like protein
MSRTRLASGLMALLVGTEQRMVARRALCLLSCFVYSVWNVLLLAYAVPNGLLSSPVAWFFMIYNGVALCTFYPLVRSRITSTWRDPGLVAPQILWASGAMIMAYAVAPVVRPGAFQTLSLIQVFGFLTLRPHQALRVGATVIGMLSLAWCFMFWWAPEHVDLRAEGLKIAGACFGLAVLTLQSRRFALLRERTHKDKLALADAADKLRRITCRDALTGLFNRAHMDERLQAEAQRGLAGGPGFSVALVDLDHFKRINDSHGHQAGDAVLIDFAKVALETLRDTDVVGRLGGEEFLILMPDTVPGDNACVALRRLHERLAQHVVNVGSAQISMRFSCGIADWAPGISVDHLLEQADKALYQAKAQGRHRTVLAQRLRSAPQPAPQPPL